MAKVVYKRGPKAGIDNVAIQDGQIIVTIDTGEIYIDVPNSENEIIRKQFLSGKSIEFKFVQFLPATGEPNIIYFVPKPYPEIYNGTDEYIYSNNAWEKIGDTKVDLTDYYTKTEVNNKIDQKQNLVDETLTTDSKTIVGAINELNINKGTYSKPQSGIPKSDLSNSVQTSLGKADTALQQHQDISGKADKTYVDTELATKVNKEQGKGLFSGSYNDLTDKPTIPTQTSQLTNNSGFITNAVNNLVNYYLKSETYNKTEVNNLISQIQTSHFEVVTALPAVGESNVIYLLPRQTAETSNVYDEYIYISGAWEKIGNTDVDLTGYATEDWVNTQIAGFLTQTQIEGLINTALTNYYTKTEVDTELAKKQNTIDSSHKLSYEYIDGLSTVGHSGSYTDLSDTPSLASVATTGSYTDLTNKPTIPTKTSELTNDSGYVTDSELATVATTGNYNDLINKPRIGLGPDAVESIDGFPFMAKYDSNTNEISSTYATKTELETKQDVINSNNKLSYDLISGTPTIPAKTSDLTNDSGFITNAVNNLVNYYLKSETYNKTEVNNLISQIQTSHFEVVTALPAVGESNVIYLLPRQTTETSNIYDEYIYISNAYEKIGSTDVDLTGYATEAWVNTQIAGFLTQSQVQNLINTALTNYYTKSDFVDFTAQDIADLWTEVENS